MIPSWIFIIFGLLGFCRQWELLYTWTSPPTYSWKSSSL